MGKTPCCDKANVKKGPWSPEEDSLLKKYVETHGAIGNWIALPKKAGLTRCGKSCRLRWLNYLRPDIKHGNFTTEEEQIIYSLHNNFGNKWSKIAAKLPGRTDNEIKNYWNTKLKKKVLPGPSNINHTFNLTNNFQPTSSVTLSHGYGFFTSTNGNSPNFPPMEISNIEHNVVADKFITEPVQFSVRGHIHSSHSVGDSNGYSISSQPQEVSVSSSCVAFEESFKLLWDFLELP